MNLAQLTNMNLTQLTYMFSCSRGFKFKFPPQNLLQYLCKKKKTHTHNLILKFRNMII